MHRWWFAIASLGVCLVPNVGCRTAVRGAGGGAGDAPGADDPGAPPGGPDAGAAGTDSGGSACPLSPDAPLATVEARFTAGGVDADRTIRDRLVTLLDAVPPGGQVRAAFAYLDDVEVATALSDARERGVRVSVVIDERNQIEKAPGVWRWNEAVTSLQHSLGEDLIICGGADLPPDGGGCIGGDKMHDSFVLLSQLCDGSNDVVVQSSGYPTKSQLFEANDMVVATDAALYAAYAAYFQDLRRHHRNPDYFRIADGDHGTRLFLYPRAPSGNSGTDPSSDTVYRLLHDNVSCGGGTRVVLAMAYWSSSRDYLVDELGRLSAAGCAVDVVASQERTTDPVAAGLVHALGQDHVRLAEHVHHKFVVVDGSHSGADARLVWTGTQDFTQSALRANDEVLLRIDDPAVVSDYLAAWQALFAAAPAAATVSPPAAAVAVPSAREARVTSS